MKSKIFVFEVAITVEEDDLREFFDLEEGEEREFTDDDYSDCADWLLEKERCQYELIEIRGE